MNFHLTRKSSNIKTGKIPVSTTTAESCPPECPLKDNVCYAKFGKLGMHWRKVSDGERGGNLDAFCDQISALPDGQIWRHNQAGDLPGSGGKIDRQALDQIVKANKGKRGFTYTHYDPIKRRRNAAAIKAANQNGFTVNLSANNLAHADQLAALDIGPVVAVVPEDSPNTMSTPEGRKAIKCPATYRDNVNCASCGLCQLQGSGKAQRVIIVFPAHGSGKKNYTDLKGV